MDKYYILKFFLLIVVLILAIFFLYKSNYLEWQLKTFGISINTKDYKVTKMSHYIFEKRRSTDITAKREEEIIRIKIIEQMDEETAERYTTDIFHSLESHFVPEEILAIYADILTAIIKIPEELKPFRNETVLENKTISYYIVYLDKQLSYLIYSLEQARYKGLFTLIYCNDEKILVGIEILTPVKQFNLSNTLNMLQSFRC